MTVEDPTPEMLARGAAVLARATGNPETIAHDVWQAMWDEWHWQASRDPRSTEFDGNTVKTQPEEPYFLDRAYGEIQARFDALVEELTDANVEITRLRNNPTIVYVVTYVDQPGVDGVYATQQLAEQAVGDDVMLEITELELK